MVEKRERMEVVRDMLKTISDNRNEVGPTKLIRLSNLSPMMFKQYTKELLESGVAGEKATKGKKFFFVTDKGFEFLEKYSKFKRFVEEIGL